MKDLPNSLTLGELILLELSCSATEEQSVELKSLLEQEPDNIDYYVEFMMLYSGLSQPGEVAFLEDDDEDDGVADFDALLQALAENERRAPTVLVEKPIEKSVDPKLGLMKVEKPKRTISRLSVYTLILSAAAMLFLMILVLSSPIRPVVATLTDSINAEWISDEETPIDSDVLREGKLTLIGGLAEITFNDGAVVVVEAPAVIELESAKSIFVTSGKLTAVVSEYATGFTVNTLNASIIDLGTEFGVSVEGDGSCSLHMFDGKANLIAGRKDQKRTSRMVTVGEAKRVDRAGATIQDVSLDEAAFMRPAKFEVLSKAAKGSTYHRWLLYSNELRMDPSLVAYYTFYNEDQSPEKLLNRAESTHGKLDGVLAAGVDSSPLPKWTQGRWREKGALEFDRDSEHYITVKHDPALNLSEQITIACWVWFEDESGGGHIVSKRTTDNGQGVQFSCFGEITEMVTGNNKQANTFQYLSDDNIYNKRRPLRMTGQWQHIAVTCNSNALSFYVNGELIETTTGRQAMSVTDGDLLIGKSLVSDYVLTNMVRDPYAFDGLIDEIAIFSRSLKVSKIREMYQAGRP